MAGTVQHLDFPARVVDAAPDAVTIEARLSIERADFGLTWNKAGMIKSPAYVTVTARFVKEP